MLAFDSSRCAPATDIVALGVAPGGEEYKRINALSATSTRAKHWVTSPAVSANTGMGSWEPLSTATPTVQNCCSSQPLMSTDVQHIPSGARH
jgi:hypothetical protein